MAPIHVILLVCVTHSVVMVAQASQIKFEAAPSELKTNLSTSASMRCSLADTQTTSPLGKRGVSSTSDDVLHISSIIISRNNGQEVASVTPFDPPTAVVDLGNLEVKGDAGVSSQGFLQLTWADPAAMALGEYMCEINTIEAGHHQVAFTASLEMTSVEPSIGDVITEFNRQMTRMQSTKDSQIRALHNQLDSVKTCVRTRVSFMAVLSAANFQGTVYNFPVDHAVVFDKIYHNTGGSYDHTTGQFVCKTAGVYEFNIHGVSYVGQAICLKLQVNNDTVTSMVGYDTITHDSASMSAVLHLDVNDVVQVLHSHCGHSFFNRQDIWQPNTFDGHLIHSDDCKV